MEKWTFNMTFFCKKAKINKKGNAPIYARVTSGRARQTRLIQKTANKYHRRNVKTCRELKLRFGLPFAKGKEHAKVERLRNTDKLKYQIYAAIGRALPECQRMTDLAAKLKRQGIEVRFIHRGNNPRKEVQGRTFTKAGRRAGARTGRR